MQSPRRVDLLLFVLAWISFAYFHQGGGWNQNGRFAVTRALVESRVPWIDDYMVYAPRGAAGSSPLRRASIRDGGFAEGGHTFALAWSATGGALVPLSPNAPDGARLLHVDTAAVTGDLAFARGHVHPNKAPGTSFAAAPAYAVVWALERVAGIDPDDAWVLTLNAWLTGALSVGLVAALGTVCFRRLASRWTEGRVADSVFATVAFAFGTLYFPYATMLYDHDLVAAALLAALLFAFDARADGELPPAAARWRLVAAGACAGAAVVASYLSAVAAVILALYVARRVRRPGGLLVFAAGSALPLALLAAYNVASFGTPLTTNYAWQNVLFRNTESRLLDVFGAPDWGLLATLLVSPVRGLFAGSPVLLLGVAGLFAMLRSKNLRAEGLVCAAMFLHVLAFNMTFKAWHGGWAAGPRYLIPAIPFLALPIALVRPRHTWIRPALLAVSIAGMSLVTAVDAQVPWVERINPPASPPWTMSPVWSVDLPQFLEARPGAYGRSAWPPSIVSWYREPVSANPGGIFEAKPARFFPLDAPQTRWNAFNAGEALLPGRRESLIPWLVIAAALGLLLRRAVGS